MKLLNFSTEIFAGIKNKSLEFEDGLNILIGENEAGKSSIINAIYSSLFVSPQIKLNTTEGKEFKKHYFPYPNGDYAAAEIKIEKNNKEYKFYKKWSNNNYQAHLELPDGVKIESEAKIKNYRSELLSYGKSTFKNIVFSSQKEIKSTLERISKNKSPELVDTISSFLRRAVMELDGISIDKFKEKLNNMLSELTKKWDLDSNSVSNSDRGINNPYKVGTGKIYDCFIEKESLRNQINQAELKEKQYNDLNLKINKLKEKEDKLKNAIQSLSKLETEINQRASLEVEKKNLNEKITEIKKIKDKWPLIEEEIKIKNKKLAELSLAIKNLKAEKERAEKLNKKEKLSQKKEKIAKLNSQLKQLKTNLEKIKLTKKDLKNLEKYQAKMQQSQASIKAAKLRAKINDSLAESIKVTTGIGEEREIKSGEIVEAEGYIHIKTENIDIEIESAEIDFQALENEFQLNKNNLKNLKNKFDLKGIKAARERLSQKKEIENKIENKIDKKEELLEGQSLEELNNKLQEYKDLKKARVISLVENKIEEKNEAYNNLKTEIAVKESKVEAWQEKYGSLSQLLVKLETDKGKIKSIKNELSNLTSLPDEYNNAQDFKDDLKSKRQQIDEINQDLRKKLQQIKELENQLPKVSTSKMEKELKQLEADFSSLTEKAKSLILIREKMEQKLKDMDQNSFKPLIKSFSKNLSFLTHSKYQGAEIDQNFKVSLKSDFKKIPANINLLSYGTYDAAALALRFAIFDNLFSDIGGFIILDDCLVNLDPQRKKRAIKLINEYQKKYQIIYTTCNPERIKDFRANIIQI